MWTLIVDLVKQQYPNRLSSPQKMWTLIVDLVKQQYSKQAFFSTKDVDSHCRFS